MANAALNRLYRWAYWHAWGIYDWFRGDLWCIFKGHVRNKTLRKCVRCWRDM